LKDNSQHLKKKVVNLLRYYFYASLMLDMNSVRPIIGHLAKEA